MSLKLCIRTPKASQLGNCDQCFKCSPLRGKPSYLCGVAFATNTAVSQHIQLGTVRHDGSLLELIHENSHFLKFYHATHPLSYPEDLPPSSILPE